MIAPDGYLTVAQAAKRLGVAERTVRKLIEDGQVLAVLPQGRERGMLIPETALWKYFAGFAPVPSSQDCG